MKRTTCSVSVLLLAAALLSSGQLLMSCGDESDADNGIMTAPEQTESVSETAAETEAPIDYFADRLTVDDGVPTQDFGGKIFRFLTYWGESTYISDEANGEVVNDAVYQRTSLVSERFNIEFDAMTEPDYGMIIKLLNSSVMANDNEYQLFCGQAIESGGNVKKNLYKNWYDVPYVDFTKPWWPNSNIEDLTYSGKAFLAVASMSLSTLTGAYCFYFNKDLAKTYEIPDMYGIVNDGKWTADMLMSLSKNLYRDVNGDSVMDENDQYGYAIWLGSAQNTYLWAFGEKLAKKQPDGTMVMDYYNERVTNIYAKLKELTFDTPGVFAMGYSYPGDTHLNMFRENRLLFVPGALAWADSFRSLESDYGIIPYPKYDEAQEEYWSMVDGSHEVIAVPTSCEDVEFVGSIIEVLEAETWKRVIPAYYDVALKVKGTRDETSVAMLDYIVDHTVYDFGYIYGYWGAAFWPQYLAETKSADIASYYAKNHKSYDTRMKKCFEYFDEYED